jgi:hypothetical protein
MSKGGQKTKTTQTNGLTGQSLGLQNDIYGTAKRAAAGYQTAGIDPNSQAAAGAYGGMIGAGQNGLAALGGDQAQMQKLMNPYQGQVLDAMNAQYGRAQAGVTANTNDQATRAGAFGGSRHGVAEGIAQGQLANEHMGQVAGVLQSGYNNAQNVAGQLATMGLNGANGSADMGKYMRDIEQQRLNPDAARLGLLGAGMVGGGTASSQQSTTTQMPGTSWMQNLGGLASIGAGFLPGGSALKAGMSLFGKKPSGPTGYDPSNGPGGMFTN